MQKKEYRHSEKKLARLLFDFGVMSQVLSTQPTVIVNNRRRRSHSVDNSYNACGGGVTTVELCWQQPWSDAQVEQDAVLIFEHILHFKPVYLSRGGIWGEIWM